MTSFLSGFLLPFGVAVAGTFLTTFCFDRFSPFFQHGKEKTDVRKNGPKVIVRQLPASSLPYGETTYLFSLKADEVQGRPNRLQYRRLYAESDLPQPQEDQYYVCCIRNNYYDLGCSVEAIDMGKAVENSCGATDGFVPAHSNVVYCAPKGLHFDAVILNCGDFLLEFNAKYEGAPKSEFPEVTRKPRRIR